MSCRFKVVIKFHNVTLYFRLYLFKGMGIYYKIHVYVSKPRVLKTAIILYNRIISFLIAGNNWLQLIKSLHLSRNNTFSKMKVAW